MQVEYDQENIFAKIIKGEIPNKTVLETEHSLAFEDIAPKAPIHILIIPKGPYVNYDHFVRNASEAELLDFNRALGTIIQNLGCAPSDGGNGYRLVSNAGADGVQEVPHMHVHIIAGRSLGGL